MSLIEQIDKNNIPQHVAFIMDGNGRWAKKLGQMRMFGHQKGAKTVNNIVKTAINLNVKYVTIYAFSTENWKRPVLEIQGLMDLLMKSIDEERKVIMDNDIRISVIGELNRLPHNVADKVADVIEMTKNNKRLHLIVALSYSGRWDLEQAAIKMAKDCVAKRLSENDIEKLNISDYLATKGIPDPELLVRTSGELRISNFLLYQIAYSELYFTDTLWPDFSEDDFYKAIIDYQKRERRFGKTSEQIKIFK